MRNRLCLIFSYLFFLVSTQDVFGTTTFTCLRECYSSLSCSWLNCGNSAARIAVKSKENIKWELLNLKPHSENLKLNSAIEIDQSDILNIAVAGNSWVKFTGLDANVVMDVGVANSTNPQAWVLPNNFRNYIDEYSQYDFISPASVPASLQLSGTTHVTKSLGVDGYGNDIDIFDHYVISSSEMNHIGTSFDLETNDDDVFDEPDFEFMDVCR